MKPSDQLHALIQTLDKNEKRYCMLHFQAPSRKNGQVLTRLFKAISSQPQYDEAALKQALTGQAWLKRLSAEKANLYKAILEALLSYAQASVPEQIQTHLSHARILQGKGLYDQAAKQLARAERLAQAEQIPLAQLQVQATKRKLIKEQVQKGRKEQLLASWNQSAEALAILRQETELEELYDRFFLLGRQEFVLRGEQAKTELGKWLQSPSMQSHTALLSRKARISQNLVWAIYHQLLGQFEDAHQKFGQIKEIWEADPPAIASHPEKYLTALANFLHSSCLINDYAAIPPVLEQMDALEVHNWNQAAERFQNRNYYQLLYLLNNFDLSSAMAQIPQIVEGLEEFSTKINGARRLAFFYNFAITYFLGEDFRNAKRWLQRILDGSESENRQDIRQMARIMVVICHYELKDHEMLESLFQSASRHLRRRARLYPAELQIFRHLRSIVYAPGNATRLSEMQAFWDWLQQLQHGKAATRPMAILEISFWLQSKIQGVSIADIALQSLT